LSLAFIFLLSPFALCRIPASTGGVLADRADPTDEKAIWIRRQGEEEPTMYQ
jgi:hypothetical protein